MRVIYRSGSYTIAYDFDTYEQYSLWACDVKSIEDEAANIADNGDPEAPAHMARCREWLDHVTAFQNRFGGESLVPPDIKWTVNDVEQDIGAPVTQWTDPPQNHVNVHPAPPTAPPAMLLMWGPPFPAPLAPPAPPPLEQPEDAAEEAPVAHKSDNAHNDDNA